MFFRGKRKFLLYLYLLFVGALSAQTTVLQKHISLHVKNQSLCEVLKNIEKQANVSFVYVSGTVSCNKNLTLDANNKTLEWVLQRILADKAVDFRVSGKSIVITPKKPKLVSPPKTQTPPVKAVTPAPLAIQSPSLLAPASTIIDSKPDTAVLLPKQSVSEPDTLELVKSIVLDTVQASVEPASKNEKKKSEKNNRSSSSASRNAPLSNYSIGAWGDYLIVNEQFDQASAATDTYLHIKDSEGASEILQAGLSFKYHLKNFEIQAGVGLSQRSWVVDVTSVVSDTAFFVGKNLGQGSPQLQAGSTLRAQGVPGPPVIGPVQDSVQVFTNTIGSRVSNKLLYLTLPVQLNYVYSFNNFFAARIGLGADFNILLQSDGYLLVDTGFDELKNYMRPFSINAKSQLGLDLKLSKHHTVSILSGFNMPLLSAYKSAYPIKRTLYAFPLTLAYHWRF